MKTETTARLATRLLTMIVVASALVSCKLPPRYAMREIQSKGLFTYLGTDYSRGYYGSPYGGGAYASSYAPFQARQPYTEPRANRQIPYRSTYHTNRNLRADYDRVPYRPRTVTRSSHSYSPPPSRVRRSSSPSVVETSPDPVRSRPSVNPLPDKVVTDTTTVTPAPAAVPAVEENLPFGTPVAGRPGMVVSPYTDPSKKQLVDVTGLPAGEKVKDPYSGKLFRVPPTAQADNKVKTTAPEAPAKPEGSADKAQPKQP